MLAVSSTPCQTKNWVSDFKTFTGLVTSHVSYGDQTKQFCKGTQYQTKLTSMKDVFYKDSHIYSDLISCNCKMLLYYCFVAIRTNIYDVSFYNFNKVIVFLRNCLNSYNFFHTKCKHCVSQENGIRAHVERIIPPVVNGVRSQFIVSSIYMNLITYKWLLLQKKCFKSKRF